MYSIYPRSLRHISIGAESYKLACGCNFQCVFLEKWLLKILGHPTGLPTILHGEAKVRLGGRKDFCWDFLAAGEVKYMICRVYRHTSIVNSVYHGKEEKTSAQKGLL